MGLVNAMEKTGKVAVKEGNSSECCSGYMLRFRYLLDL